jgi:hypothetical protein
MIELFEELDKFRDITYYDEPHDYLIDGVKYESTTGLLGEYKEKFDSQYWAKRKAKENSITVEEQLLEWEVINKVATTKGTIIHNYIEDRLANKVFPYPDQFVFDEVGHINLRYMDVVKKKVEVLMKMADSFIDDIAGKLLPIKSELVVGDLDYRLCGMVDQLFYNYKAKELQIWDWKTNKRLDRYSKYKKKMKGELSHLDECHINTYSLQLSVYKYIIEKNTNIKLGDCFIVWFFEDNSTYEVIKCKELSEEVKIILNKRIVN